jgi:hypothetical protein
MKFFKKNFIVMFNLFYKIFNIDIKKNNIVNNYNLSYIDFFSLFIFSKNFDLNIILKK